MVLRRGDCQVGRVPFRNSVQFCDSKHFWLRTTRPVALAIPHSNGRSNFYGTDTVTWATEMATVSKRRLQRLLLVHKIKRLFSFCLLNELSLYAQRCCPDLARKMYLLNIICPVVVKGIFKSISRS